MVGFFSTRGNDGSSGSSVPELNMTVVNNSSATTTSQDGGNDNTVLGLLVL